jgi:hypothetical protein
MDLCTQLFCFECEAAVEFYLMCLLTGLVSVSDDFGRTTGDRVDPNFICFSDCFNGALGGLVEDSSSLVRLLLNVRT